MAGGKIDILVEPNTKGFVPKMESGLQGAIGAAGKLGAALGVAMGGAEMAKTVVTVGKEFESQLNTMKAVSQATGEQLEAVTQRARELGNDTSLTATSASDAAAAMTELAKGGFTVEQSMEAAKGTLQLASAAQTDAATAATIQSQALQAFSLDASNAARVSDILAGAANASSAEIGDVAQALQQSGAVANQFGVSIEDTATAIAMFANAGITGSDAGTLLKTSLLSLTDQGKPAQRAIEELGLTVYDAQGKFVGLPVLMGQLKKAAQEMTPEAYQAATATLFGSDAMRMAGVAAQQGKEGFDDLSAAVTRQGQAAEVAAAQTAGLPGAMERLENTIEDVALGTYEALSGTLVAGVDAATGAIDTLGGFTEDAISGLKAAASVAGDLFAPMEGSVKAAGGALQGLAGPIVGATVAFAALKKLDVPSHMGVARESAQRFGQQMQVQVALAKANGVELTRMGAALSVVEARYPVIGRMAESARKASSPMMTLGADTKRWSVELDGASRVAGVARGSILQLGGAAKGVAAGGFSLLKSGVNGLVGALGGPFNVAMMGGAALIGMFVQSARSASNIQDKLAEASRNAAEAQSELRTAVAGTTGALNEQGLVAASKIATAEMTQLTAIGEKLNSVFNVIQAPDMGFWEQGFWNKEFNDYRREVTQTKEAYDALKSAAGELKIPMDDLGRVVAEGGPQFEQLMSHLDGGGEASQRAAQQLRDIRAEVEQLAKDAQALDPGFVKISDGLRAISESGDDADKKLAGLRSTLQGMGLLPENAQQAMLDLAKEIDGLAASSANAVDQSGALGDALANSAGEIQGTDKNAQSLNDALTRVSDSYLRAVSAGNDASEAYALVRPELEALGREYGLTADKVEALARKYGMVPEVVSTLVKFDGATEAQRAIGEVWGSLTRIPPETRVEVKALSEPAVNALDELGIKVETIPGSTNVNVYAETDEAKAALDSVVERVASIGNQDYTVEMVMDPTPLEGSAAEAEQILAGLGEMTPTPEADLIIDKLQSGKDISVGELNYLASLTPTPVADLADELVNSKADNTAGKLKDLANMPVKPVADLDTGPAEQKIGWLQRSLEGLKNWWGRVTTNGLGGISRSNGYATGGRLPTSGPGTEKTDGFLGINSEGMPLARVDAGEWVINRRSSDRYHAELAAINAGVFPKLPGYATGGVLSSNEIKSKLAFLDGTPYQMGGFSPASVDCSGAVSAVVNVYQGESPFASRMSTSSEGPWLTARGATLGKGGAGDIRIGWWDRGGGAMGHTAVQLADGTYIESGGNTGGGFTIGKTAGPLEGRGFTDWAHFPDADKGGSSARLADSADSASLSSGSGRTQVSWGAADKTFDIVSSLFGAKLYDQGGYLPHGGTAVNLSGKPEPVFTAGQWASLSAFTQSMRQVAAQLPGVVDGFRRASENLDATAAGLEAIAPKDGSRSIADAPTSAMDVLDDLTNSFAVAAGNFHANPARFGLNVGGALLPEVFGGLRDAERGLNDTRQAAKDGVVEIAEREKELAEAREALAKLDAEGGGYDKATQRKLADAEKALSRARAAGKPDKIADAEEKLRRAREDAADKLSDQDKKRAKDRDKAADTVMKAEKNLNTARTQTAQLAAQIGAGEITLAIEAAKAVYNLGKTVYETVKKVAEWISSKINAVEGARVATLSQSVEMMDKLAKGMDEARNKLTQLRMTAVNSLLAEQQAQWQLGQARSNYQQTQLRGIVDVANARAKITSAELVSLKVIGTSVDDLWARTLAGLESGKLTFGETVESAATAVREKLALEADAHKAQAEALKANADAALQLLDSSKAAAKASLAAKSATALLAAQAGRLKAMSQLGDGSVTTPQAMRMQRVTQLLAEAADWRARDVKEIKVEESRRYRAAEAQAKAEAMRILEEHFGGQPEYGQYVAEINAVMDRAGHYGFWNSAEDAQKVIEAALKNTSLGRAVQQLETQQVEQQIADYEKTLAEAKVEAGNLAIDAQYAPQEAKARGDVAVADQQVSYFTSLTEYYKASDETVKAALSELMEFNKSQTSVLTESTGKQVTELQAIAKTATSIYEALPGLDYRLSGVAELPPSRTPREWSGEVAAAMDGPSLHDDDLNRIASRVLGSVDVPQIGSRYGTREEVEAARRARDEQLRAAIDAELARTRDRQLAAQLDRRFAAIERTVAPEVTITLPNTEVVRTEDVAREMRDGLAKMGARVTVLEGRNGANYYKTRM